MLASPIAKPDPRLRTELLKASARQCRYIVSDGVRDAICCGAPAVGRAELVRLTQADRLYATRSERQSKHSLMELIQSAHCFG
jgi:hypothetical protein